MIFLGFELYTDESRDDESRRLQFQIKITYIKALIILLNIIFHLNRNENVLIVAYTQRSGLQFPFIWHGMCSH